MLSRASPDSRSKLLARPSAAGKIVAAGVNYAGHAAEQIAIPPTTGMFAELTSAVVGPDADVRWRPALTQAVGLEAELGGVIGAPAGASTPAKALDDVLGYTCMNDVSARDLQYSDKQFVRAKSLDTSAPMGPWPVTPDEAGDPQNGWVSAAWSTAK